MRVLWQLALLSIIVYVADASSKSKESRAQRRCMPKPADKCNKQREVYIQDKETRQCKKVSGCFKRFQGFKREATCKRICIERKTKGAKKKYARRKPQKDDICSLPKAIGMCRAVIQRYYFNKKSGNCEMFSYGGCGGNGNNFEKLEDCEDKCKMKSKRNGKNSDSKQKKKKKKYIRRKNTHHQGNKPRDNNRNKDHPKPKPRDNNRNKDHPKPKPWDNNRNKDHSKPKPEFEKDKDACQLPKQVGMCRAAMPRYFFNSESAECEKFMYGGCGGNKNNFMTLEECHDMCTAPYKLEDGKPINTEKREKDKQISEFEEKYRRDNRASRDGKDDRKRGRPGKKSNKKNNGNKNNENNKDKDDRKRGRPGKQSNKKNNSNKNNENNEVEDPCYLPSDHGPCQPFVPIKRYFFNKKTMKCESFSYGGCKGNLNNFINERECQATCDKDKIRPNREKNGKERKPSSEVRVCHLQKQVGKCKAAVQRYYFNSESGECEQFIYGGCGGNGNNFRTLDDCEERCKNIEVSKYKDKPEERGRDRHARRQKDKMSRQDKKALKDKPKDEWKNRNANERGKGDGKRGKSEDENKNKNNSRKKNAINKVKDIFRKRIEKNSGTLRRNMKKLRMFGKKDRDEPEKDANIAEN